MQPIKIYNMSLYNNSNRQIPNFSGSATSLGKIISGITPENELDTLLSKTSLKLFKRMDDYIERTWTAIRKKEVHSKSPEYFYANKRDGLITVKPVYNGKNSILMEIEKNGSVERILFDRKKPCLYRYERSVTTPTGSLTTKIFDSKQNRNPNIEARINNLVEKYFPEIIPYKVMYNIPY